MNLWDRKLTGYLSRGTEQGMSVDRKSFLLEYLKKVIEVDYLRLHVFRVSVCVYARMTIDPKKV